MPTKTQTSLKVVWFDFGFTLWNEQCVWTNWAEWLGVSTLDLFTTLGGVIERGEHHHRVFEIFRPGMDLAKERRLQSVAGQCDAFLPEELYPDVIPCLERLKAAGFRTGVAGNHFADFSNTLRGMNAPLDFISSSEEWGVEKPSPEFFAHIVRASGVSAREIAYVGDRLDNDVLPAKAVGITSVFLLRGPWGMIHSLRPEAAQADIRINSLTALPDELFK